MFSVARFLISPDAETLQKHIVIDRMNPSSVYAVLVKQAFHIYYVLFRNTPKMKSYYIKIPCIPV